MNHFQIVNCTRGVSQEIHKSTMKNLPPVFVGSDAWKDPEELQAYVTECSDLTSEWKFLCKICCRPGKNRRDVRNHVESIHFPTMSVFLFKINFRPTWQVIFFRFVYKCTFCEMSLKSRKALDNHKYRKHPRPDGY